MTGKRRTSSSSVPVARKPSANKAVEGHESRESSPEHTGGAPKKPKLAKAKSKGRSRIATCDMCDGINVDVGEISDYRGCDCNYVCRSGHPDLTIKYTRDF